MKAIRIHQFGGPEVLTLEEIPTPKPGPSEVLVQMRAAGINPVDAKTRAGKALFRNTHPFPFIPGWDVSGVVVEKGKNATRFNLGDEVFGMIHFPEVGSAYAEFVTAPEDHLTRKPANLSHIEAAALPLVSLTAWQALFDVANLSRNQTILVHAAAGGVGHIAVQLAKSVGAYIYGTASEAHREFLLNLGVDNFVNYRKTRFEEAIECVDVILDTLGGEIRDRSWQVLKPGGILVSLRSTPFDSEPESYKVHGKNILVQPNANQLAQIADLVENHVVHPHIFQIFPLEAAAAAHRLLEQGRTEGKIVLSISG